MPNQQYSIIWPVIISHELVKKRIFRHILHQRVRVWIKKQLLFRYFAHERGGKYFFFFFTTKGSLVGLIVNKYEEIDRQKKKNMERGLAQTSFPTLIRYINGQEIMNKSNINGREKMLNFKTQWSDN